MPSNKSKQSNADNDVYEMEAIIDFKQERKVDYFKIKWKNYGLQDATWEPRKNIINPDEQQRILMRDLKAKWLSDNLKQDDGFSVQRLSSNVEKSDSPDVIPDLIVTDAQPDESNEENGSPNYESMNKAKKAAEKRPFSQIKSNSIIADEELKDEEKVMSEPKVKHIRAVSGVPYALMDVPTVDNSIKRLCLSVTEARENYSDALLDYLLQRMRFKDNNNPSATSPV